MSFLERVGNFNVLIIGDVMIDTYLNGKVSRISPEAPVPVVEFRSRVERLGGAANVALNIKALDANPLLLSIVGDDDNGVLFRELLHSEHISSKYIIEIPGRQTTIKTRIMSGNQQLLRIDKEDISDLDVHQMTLVEGRLLEILNAEEIKVIILQDYNKGLLTEALIQKIIESANTLGIPVVVDPKRKNFFAYKNVALFKPNFKEISEALSARADINIEELRRLAISLNAMMPHQMTMITLSEKGIFTFDGEKSNLSPTQPRNIADVCGAGDSVIAVAALGIAAGENITEVARIANIAGGQVCEEIGVVPVCKEKLLAEI